MRLLFLILLVGYVSCRLNFRSMKVLKPNVRTLATSLLRGGSSENTTTVLITTNVGSPFLDKVKKLTVPLDSTVKELKDLIAIKFAGSPPVELIKLFLNDRLLKDDEAINDTLSPLSPIGIQLDLMSGTAVYDKTMHSVSQAIEGYASTIVQQAFIGEKLKDLSVPESKQTSTKESVQYQEMLKTVRDSLYSQHGEAIKSALEAEKNPELPSDDTKAWRRQSAVLSPLAQRLAKEFDLNARGLQVFVFYTVLLMVMARFAAPDSVSSLMMVTCIPMLWVSKLRQLRLASKILSYVLLPYAAQHDFWMPLLSAPYQAIARESLKWLKRDAPAAEAEEQDEELRDGSSLLHQPLRRNSKWLKGDVDETATAETSENELVDSEEQDQEDEELEDANDNTESEGDSENNNSEGLRKEDSDAGDVSVEERDVDMSEDESVDNETTEDGEEGEEESGTSDETEEDSLDDVADKYTEISTSDNGNNAKQEEKVETASLEVSEDEDEEPDTDQETEENDEEESEEGETEDQVEEDNSEPEDSEELKESSDDVETEKEEEDETVEDDSEEWEDED